MGAARKRFTGICQHCGLTFRQRIGSGYTGKYCDKNCAAKARASSPSWRRKTAAALQRTNSAKRLARCDKYFEDNPGAMCPATWCIVCNSYSFQRKVKNFCSLACKRQHQNTHSEFYNRIANGRPFTQINICPETGFLFVPQHLKMKYIDREAANRAAKRSGRLLRKMRTKTNGRCESIDPFEVFQFANWKCQICGVATPRHLRGTFEACAPELDHIVPIALGGTHTWGNVQCLCRACNSVKTDQAPKHFDPRAPSLGL